MIESPIFFDDLPHTYTNKHTGELYSSVSSVIDIFKEKFSPTLDKTRKLRDKNGWDHNRVLSHWREVNKISITRGTFVHKCLEHFLNNNLLLLNYYLSKCCDEELVEIDDKGNKIHEENFKIDILNYINFAESLNIKKKDVILLCEFVLWNDELQIAGTPDLLQLSHKGIFIGDWKTNKKFTKYNPFKQYLKGPLDNLHDCHINIYSIQLNIYAYIAEKIFNMPVWKLEIYHLKKGEVETIPIAYDRSMAETVLKYYQNQKLFAA